MRQGETRRCRSKKTYSHLPPNESRLHMQTESLLRELAEDLGNLKGQERSLCTRKDERKKKEKKGEKVKWAWCSWGIWRRREIPESWKDPSPADRSARTGGSFRGLEKRALSRLRQTGQSDGYTEGLSHSPCTQAWDTRWPVWNPGRGSLGFGEETREKVATDCADDLRVGERSLDRPLLEDAQAATGGKRLCRVACRRWTASQPCSWPTAACPWDGPGAPEPAPRGWVAWGVGGRRWVIADSWWPHEHTLYAAVTLSCLPQTGHLPLPRVPEAPLLFQRISLPVRGLSRMQESLLKFDDHLQSCVWVAFSLLWVYLLYICGFHFP